MRRGITRRAVLAASVAASGTAAAQPRGRLITGVNLAGLEFKSSRLPGRLDHDFVAPTEAELRYYKSCGASAVRIPFLWERLQPEIGETFDAAHWELLAAILAAADRLRLQVILDPHQFGRRSGEIIGEGRNASAAVFGGFWAELARRCRGMGHVIFNLQNEPHDQDAAILAQTNEAAIAAIRGAGARQLILVPGAAWSGAHSWVSSGNAGAMTTLYGDNLAFDVHQYLDADSSGTHRECVDGAGQRLIAFTEWARAHDKKGFLGEFGASSQADCLTELAALLDYVSANRDVWIGWTYWAGGPWWPDDYPLSIEPTSLDHPEDKPQMAVLRRYFE